MEFGNVERSDLKAASFDMSARAREGRGKDDRAAEREGVGGMRFGGIGVDPVIAGEGRVVEPGAVGEERVAANVGDGGF